MLKGRKMDILKIAEKIIAEKGGDKFIELWLRDWLRDPDHLNEFLADKLKKELADSFKGNKKKQTPGKIQ